MNTKLPFPFDPKTGEVVGEPPRTAIEPDRSMVEDLFKLSDSVRYLLGKEVDLYECSECCCPLSAFYVERPGRLGVRCAACGAKHRSVAVDEPWLAEVAAEDRFERAIDEYEKRFGRWWFEKWHCAPRGH
jgi:hypothetical protein